MAYKKLPYKDVVRDSLEGKETTTKPSRGILIRKDVTVLKSKKERERHAAIAAKCGLDKNLRPVQKSKADLPDSVQDPAYFRDQLGDTTKLSWEEL